jgi:putative nucleotidyltransferase with HDIG domain
MTEERPFLEIIKEHIDSGKATLPVFNTIGLQLRQEAAKEESSIREIEKLIVCDQAVTSQVLKMANSAFFAGFESIVTVREAIVRLGTDQILNIVTLAAQQESFRSKDPFIQDLLNTLWRHSVGCAVGAQWIAKRRGFVDMLHEVFLAGLLHDIGKLLLLTVVEEVKESGQLQVAISSSLMNEIMKTLHAEQGHQLLEHWNLPEVYRDVAREHHAEEFDSNTLMAIVRLANKTCNKLGIGTSTDSSSVPPATLEADFLGFSEIALAELEVKLDDFVSKVPTLFSSKTSKESVLETENHPNPPPSNLQKPPRPSIPASQET